jgi:putative nucleotidyltransferase with HDIG domain
MMVDIEQFKDRAKSMSILYVEDELEVRERTKLLLNKIFSHVEVAVNGQDGLEKYLKNSYDIVITDILMPKMNGLDLIRAIRKENKKQEIIILSAYTDSEYFTQSIGLGVTGYVIKPLDFDQMMDVLEQSIDKLTAFRENEMYKTKLEEMVDERTKTVLQLQKMLITNHEDVIKSLVKMIEGRDTYTGGHSERVAIYSQGIAKAMGFSEEECDLIYQAGILHDIGKIITPDAILLKPGKLTQNEYLLIQEHAHEGFKILSRIPMYINIADIVHAHHERYDGTGYPRGLKGDEIPIFARIMMIADSFDAMTTSRIYKAKKNINEAVEELKKFSHTLYDPNIIDVAIDILKLVDIDKNVNQEPVSDLDEERFAFFYKDPLTHLYNHHYLDFILHKRKDENEFVCLNIVYIRKFTAYNKQHGWSEGDVLLRSFAIYLESEFINSKIFRIAGDDFAILSNAHQDIDIDKINDAAILKTNNLSCAHKHVDIDKININSYKDLINGVLFSN